MEDEIHEGGPRSSRRDGADCGRATTRDTVGERETDDPRRADPLAELADMRDRWMRSEAEAANVRTRAKREVEDARRFAIQKFAGDVVQAAEDLQRGLNSIPEASGTEPKIVTTLREGLLGVQRSFIDLLKRNGIVNEDPLGTAFDPQRHQAMSQSVSSLVHPAGTVSQTLSSAWTLNGRLLRPAMVVVAKAADTGSP